MTSTSISSLLPLLTAIGLSIIVLSGCRLSTSKRVMSEQTKGLVLIIVSLLGIPFAVLSMTVADDLQATRFS